MPHETVGMAHFPSFLSSNPNHLDSVKQKRMLTTLTKDFLSIYLKTSQLIPTWCFSLKAVLCVAKPAYRSMQVSCPLNRSCFHSSFQGAQPLALDFLFEINKSLTTILQMKKIISPLSYEGGCGNKDLGIIQNVLSLLLQYMQPQINQKNRKKKNRKKKGRKNTSKNFPVSAKKHMQFVSFLWHVSTSLNFS